MKLTPVIVSPTAKPWFFPTVHMVVDPRVIAVTVFSRNFFGDGIYQTVSVSFVDVLGVSLRLDPWI